MSTPWQVAVDTGFAAVGLTLATLPAPELITKWAGAATAVIGLVTATWRFAVYARRRWAKWKEERKREQEN
jgi:hypothetical protein